MEYDTNDFGMMTMILSFLHCCV